MENWENGENGQFDPKSITPEILARWGADKLVYIREVSRDELENQVSGLEDIPEDTKLYAVHAADGTRMAILDDRDAAFIGARQYDLEPVSVH